MAKEQTVKSPKDLPQVTAGLLSAPPITRPNADVMKEIGPSAEEISHGIRLPVATPVSDMRKLWYGVSILAVLIFILLGAVIFLLTRNNPGTSMAGKTALQLASPLSGQPVQQSPGLASSSPPAAPVQKIEVANTAPVIYGDKKVNLDKPADLPEAVSFKGFSYTAELGKQLSLSGACQDKYYAIVIFDSKDDYRQNPAAAKFNRAYECPENKTFQTDINLQQFNLPSGNYYLFVADQGETGSWYNPR